MKTEIFKDENKIKQFEGEKHSSKAFGYMLKIQPCSIDHALRWEGYKVIETDENGKQTEWKPYTN